MLRDSPQQIKRDVHHLRSRDVSVADGSEPADQPVDPFGILAGKAD